MRIQVRTRENSTRLRVHGEVDHSSVHRLSQAFHEAASSPASQIELDLSGVSYIDSAGICAIYDLVHELGGQKEVRIMGGGAQVLRILHLSGVTLLEGVSMVPAQRPLASEDGGLRAPDVTAPTPPGAAAYRDLPWSKCFPSEMARLGDIREFVKDVAGRVGLDQARTFNLMVAVSEASANAIEHGRDDGDVTVSAVPRPSKITVTVSHPGDFRPRTQDDPTRFRRGMGLPLMLALTDEVTIACPVSGGQGTCVSLSILLGPGHGAPGREGVGSAL